MPARRERFGGQADPDLPGIGRALSGRGPGAGQPVERRPGPDGSVCTPVHPPGLRKKPCETLPGGSPRRAPSLHLFGNILGVRRVRKPSSGGSFRRTPAAGRRAREPPATHGPQRRAGACEPTPRTPHDTLSGGSPRRAPSLHLFGNILGVRRVRKPSGGGFSRRTPAAGRRAREPPCNAGAGCHDRPQGGPRVPGHRRASPCWGRWRGALGEPAGGLGDASGSRCRRGRGSGGGPPDSSPGCAGAARAARRGS